jgi:phycocyanobilin:ferredoxin oxidoreductase
MSRFGFVELARSVERRLVAALGLEPRSLPPELARLDGVYREKPVRLEARAYSGGALGYARFVELDGGELEIGNILLLARPELGLPVFGADLVGLGRDTAVVVADLSPMTDDEAERRSQLAVLERHRTARPELETETDLPAWAEPWFSSGALCARIGSDRAADAAAAIGEFASAFVELWQRSTSELPEGERRAAPAPERARAVSERQTRYNATHRQDDRGLLLLRRMFPPERADRFLREVLFPERTPG